MSVLYEAKPIRLSNIPEATASGRFVSPKGGREFQLRYYFGNDWNPQIMNELSNPLSTLHSQEFEDPKGKMNFPVLQFARDLREAQVVGIAFRQDEQRSAKYLAGYITGESNSFHFGGHIGGWNGEEYRMGFMTHRAVFREDQQLGLGRGMLEGVVELYQRLGIPLREIYGASQIHEAHASNFGSELWGEVFPTQREYGENDLRTLYQMYDWQHIHQGDAHGIVPDKYLGKLRPSREVDLTRGNLKVVADGMERIGFNPNSGNSLIWKVEPLEVPVGKFMLDEPEVHTSKPISPTGIRAELATLTTQPR